MVVGKRPKKAFQKRTFKSFSYNGRTIYCFPDKYEFADQVAIPKDICLSPGEKPSEDKLKTLIKVWSILKAPVTNYCVIQDLVDLSGLEKETVHRAIIWLIKNGHAVGNVDRWGRLHFVKLVLRLPIRDQGYPAPIKSWEGEMK